MIVRTLLRNRFWKGVITCQGISCRLVYNVDTSSKLGPPQTTSVVETVYLRVSGNQSIIATPLPDIQKADWLIHVARVIGTIVLYTFQIEAVQYWLDKEDVTCIISRTAPQLDP